MFIANGWRKRIKLRRSGMSGLFGSGLLFKLSCRSNGAWEIIFGARGYKHGAPNGAWFCPSLV